MDNDNNYDFEDDFDEYETYDEHYENTLKDEKYFDTILNITNDLKNYQLEVNPIPEHEKIKVDKD